MPHFSLAVWWCPLSLLNRDLEATYGYLTCMLQKLSESDSPVKHSDGPLLHEQTCHLPGPTCQSPLKGACGRESRETDRKTRTSVPWQQPPFSMPPETIPLTPSFPSYTRMGVGWRQIALQKPSSLQRLQIKINQSLHARHIDGWSGNFCLRDILLSCCLSHMWDVS